MEVSAALVASVKRSEGLKLRVYIDANGAPTIGYGHRLLDSQSFKDGIDEATATHILMCDLDDAEEAVNRLVKVALTQGQFDALVDFVYNLGEGRLEGSELLKFLNAGHYNDASLQLLRWDHSGAAVNLGLKARREAEFAMWHGKTAV